MAAIVTFMAFLQLTAIIVEDYDEAIAFFTQALSLANLMDEQVSRCAARRDHE